jgi:LemA protein
MAKGTWIVLGVFGAIALILLGVLGSAVGTYNSFVNEREGVDAQSKQVDVAYQLEFRTIPQITNLTLQYFQNETELQAKVAALRSGAPPANASLNQKDAYASQVADTRALVIKVVNENYPDLKGNDLYKTTINTVINAENKIAMEKVRYNDRAQAYNAHTLQCCIPLLVAHTFGFSTKEYIGFKDRPNETSFPAGQPI